MRVVFAVGAALAVAATPVAAQSVFGDTQLSYQNGVVYDDDLVPGRGLNQPFLASEQAGGARDSFVTEPRSFIRPSSPNLIGADGRIRPVVRSGSSGR
ncbi:MAG: hypothetical protein AAGD34_12020 [Pseudomonadota bacterium]